MLPWSWAEERIAAARRYWLTTVAPDGAPHVMPVWAVWHEGALWLSTGGRSRKARNLREVPRCAVHVDGEDPVMVHGVARFATDPGEMGRVSAAYAARYGDPPPDPGANANRRDPPGLGLRARRVRVHDEPDALDVLSRRAGKGAARRRPGCRRCQTIVVVVEGPSRAGAGLA